MATVSHVTVVQSATGGYPSVDITWEFIGAPGYQFELSYKVGSWHVYAIYDYPTYSLSELAITLNTAWQFRVRVRIASWAAWGAYKNSDSITLYGDTFEETITLADVYTDVASYEDIFEETIYISDGADATIIVPLVDDFSYYLGGYDGMLYREDTAYRDDDGAAITCYYQTPQGEFSNQKPEFYDMWKTIMFVRLWYTKVYAGVTINVGCSKDGGQNFVYGSAILNEGESNQDDGSEDYQDFFFMQTGVHFTFRIENVSDTDTFSFSAMEIFFKPGGNIF